MPKKKDRHRTRVHAEERHAVRMRTLELKQQRAQTRLALATATAQSTAWYCRTSDALCPHPPSAWTCVGRSLLGHIEICPRSHGAQFMSWALRQHGPEHLRVAWVGCTAFAWAPCQAQADPAPLAAPSAAIANLVPLRALLLHEPIELPLATVDDTGAMAALRQCIKAIDQGGGRADLPHGLRVDAPEWVVSAPSRKGPAWRREDVLHAGGSVVPAVLRELCHFHPRIDHAVPVWDAFGPCSALAVRDPPGGAALHPGVQLADLIEALCVPEDWRPVPPLSQHMLHAECDMALSVTGAVGALPVLLDAHYWWVPVFSTGRPDERVSRATLMHILDLLCPPGGDKQGHFRGLPVSSAISDGGVLCADLARVCPGLQARLAFMGPVVCRAFCDAGPAMWASGPTYVRCTGARHAERERARDHVEHIARMALYDEGVLHPGDSDAAPGFCGLKDCFRK